MANLDWSAVSVKGGHKSEAKRSSTCSVAEARAGLTSMSIAVVPAQRTLRTKLESKSSEIECERRVAPVGFARSAEFVQLFIPQSSFLGVIVTESVHRE